MGSVVKATVHPIRGIYKDVPLTLEEFKAKEAKLEDIVRALKGWAPVSTTGLYISQEKWKWQ